MMKPAGLTTLFTGASLADQKRSAISDQNATLDDDEGEPPHQAFISSTQNDSVPFT
jgi:hypothetical protein